MANHRGKLATAEDIARQKAQRRSFAKRMVKSSPKCMTVPTWFFRRYDGMMHMRVGVKILEDVYMFPVSIKVKWMKNKRHVYFGAGWKGFMRYYNLRQGQHLKFTPLQTSLFEVTVL